MRIKPDKYTIILVVYLCIFIFSGCRYSKVDYRSDFENICQILIDLPEMDQYYHVEHSPSRKPLVIIKNKFTPDGIQLMKFGEPVAFLSKPEMSKDKIEAYIEFSDFKIIGKSAEVIFEYPAEGLVVKVALSRENNAWNVKDKIILEE